MTYCADITLFGPSFFSAEFTLSPISRHYDAFVSNFTAAKFQKQWWPDDQERLFADPKVELIKAGDKREADSRMEEDSVPSHKFERYRCRYDNLNCFGTDLRTDEFLSQIKEQSYLASETMLSRRFRTSSPYWRQRLSAAPNPGSADAEGGSLSSYCTRKLKRQFTYKKITIGVIRTSYK
ncbi:hypothetical protein EVAR_20572_1 [Eumeta japonica]|uniref:Uncharacterized protein n=1 Tax=Eumeta variegata TaxID=151549 RepID=A0A4C1USK5_EUMVA|nr:hypothetical protein EVAR_20572_1 [Eumeta japonica]